MDLFKLMLIGELFQVAVFFVLNILLKGKFCKETQIHLFFLREIGLILLFTTWKLYLLILRKIW